MRQRFDRHFPAAARVDHFGLRENALGRCAGAGNGQILSRENCHVREAHAVFLPPTQRFDVRLPSAQYWSISSLIES